MSISTFKSIIIYRKTRNIQTDKETLLVNIFASYQYGQLTKTKIVLKCLKWINNLRIFTFVFSLYICGRISVISKLLLF